MDTSSDNTGTPDINFKLQEANPIREDMIRATINNLIEQLNNIDDSHIVGAKDPQVFIKIKLNISEECERCSSKYKAHAIVDQYRFNDKGDHQGTDTVVLCNKCAKKLKL